jgi:hypothetical protein
VIPSRKQREAASKALNLSFYALAEQLERAGVLDQAALADEIARFDAGDNEYLEANLQGIMKTLRARPFAVRGPNLGVIEGGKTDPAE